MKVQQRKAASKQKPSYPYIGVRFSVPIDARLRTLAQNSGLKISHLLQGIVQKHLPELEKFHAAKG
jgi:predicted DNA-binding protein